MPPEPHHRASRAIEAGLGDDRLQQRGGELAQHPPHHGPGQAGMAERGASSSLGRLWRIGVSLETLPLAARLDHRCRNDKTDQPASAGRRCTRGPAEALENDLPITVERRIVFHPILDHRQFRADRCALTRPTLTRTHRPCPTLPTICVYLRASSFLSAVHFLAPKPATCLPADAPARPAIARHATRHCRENGRTKQSPSRDARETERPSGLNACHTPIIPHQLASPRLVWLECPEATVSGHTDAARPAGGGYRRDVH